MENDFKKREVVLQELSEFILSSQHVLDNTLHTLGWDESKLNSIQYKTCPFNPQHQIPEEYLDKHISKCRIRREGYTCHDVFLPDAGENAEASVVLDEETRTAVIHKAVKEGKQIKTMLWLVCIYSSYRCDAVCDSHPVPRSADRIYTSTTPDERLALYDYVVEKTKHRHTHDLPLELPFPDNGSESKETEPKTLLERKALERDAKRRRVNYKRVHTNRKSHTEILREVIQSQMEMLQSNKTSEMK